MNLLKAMNVTELYDQIVKACEGTNFPFNRMERPIETMTDLIAAIERYLRHDCPVKLANAVAQLAIANIPAEQLRSAGMLVNPTAVTKDLDQAVRLVLLDEKERCVVHDCPQKIKYVGGSNAQVVVNHGRATLIGQAEACVTGGAEVFAEGVNHVSASGRCAVYTWDCPHVEARVDVGLSLHNSYAETWGGCEVYVNDGSRLFSHQESGSITVSSKGMAVLESDEVKLVNKGLVYGLHDLPAEQMELLVDHMRQLDSMPYFYYVSEYSLEARKAFFQRPDLTHFIQEYTQQHGCAPQEAIEKAVDEKAVANVVLPFIEALVQDVPFEVIASYVPGPSLTDNHIYTSNYPMLLVDPHQPIHLFGTMTANLREHMAPVYLHDWVIAEVGGSALAFAEGHALAVVRDKASLVARGETTALFKEESYGIVSDKCLFVADDRTRVTAAGDSIGIAMGQSVAHATMDGVRLVLNGQAKGDFQVGSKGLINSPEAEVEAAGYAKLYTPYTLDKVKMEGAVQLTKVEDPKAWKQLTEQFMQTGEVGLESNRLQFKR